MMVLKSVKKAKKEPADEGNSDAQSHDDGDKQIFMDYFKKASLEESIILKIKERKWQ